MVLLRSRFLSTALRRSLFTFSGQPIEPIANPKKSKPIDVDAVLQAVREAEGITVHRKGHLTEAVFGTETPSSKRRRWGWRSKMGPREKYMFKKLRQRERQRTETNDPASDLQPLYDMMRPWLGYARLSNKEASKGTDAVPMQRMQFSKKEEATISKIQKTIEEAQFGRMQRKKARAEEAEKKLPDASDIKTFQSIERNVDGHENEIPMDASETAPSDLSQQTEAEAAQKPPTVSSPSPSFFQNADDSEGKRGRRSAQVVEHLRASLREQLATRIFSSEMHSRSSSRQPFDRTQSGSKEASEGTRADRRLERALLQDPSFRHDALKLEAESSSIDGVDDWVMQLKTFAEQHGDVLEAMDETKERDPFDVPQVPNEALDDGTVGGEDVGRMGKHVDGSHEDIDGGLIDANKALMKGMIEDGVDLVELKAEAVREFEHELIDKTRTAFTSKNRKR